MIEKFKFNQSQIGDLFAYMGIWIAIAQGGIARPISKKFSPIQILSISMIALAMVFPFILIPSESKYILLVLPFMAIFQGLTQPNATAIISNLGAEDAQGEILGINQSVTSLAQALPPIISAFAITFSRNLPILLAGISTFVAWVIFVTFYKKQQETQVFDFEKK